MKKVTLLLAALACYSTQGAFNLQKDPATFYLKDLGVYVNLKANQKIVKVPYKRTEFYYFSLKNDSIALLQMIKGGKLFNSKELNVSSTYDSVFIKRESGDIKKTVSIEKVLFRKVF